MVLGTANENLIRADKEDLIRADLAMAYQILHHLGMDDLTYTHLSARVAGSEQFYIYPFGLLFCEVHPSNLLTVSLEGKVIEGVENHYNKTGYVIHSAIYKSRPDINAIFHLHTEAGVAVSALECGLLYLSQFSFPFYNRMSYHRYDSLALDEARHGQTLAKDLGQNYAMILHNHGTLTCGKTIHEAFFYTHFLEKACRVQCAVAGREDLLVPDPEVCEKAAQDMLAFETDLGKRDWDALARYMHAKFKG